MNRTSYCGDLRKNHVGQTVTLCGWIHSRRDHGGVLFCDLRDRTGLVQIVFRPEAPNRLFDLAQQLGNEYVVEITGKVLARPEGSQNKNIPTGEIEVDVAELVIHNPSKPPPFEIS